MPCAPSEYVHVRLVEKIFKLLHIPNVIERLKNTTETKDVTQILVAFEQSQIFSNPDMRNMQRVLEDDKERQGKKE